MNLAALLSGIVELYAIFGVAFAVPFVIRGVARIDPMARGTSAIFRLLIVPGTIVFWPLLLIRWAAGSAAPPIEITAHRRAVR